MQQAVVRVAIGAWWCLHTYVLTHETACCMPTNRPSAYVTWLSPPPSCLLHAHPAAVARLEHTREAEAVTPTGAQAGGHAAEDGRHVALLVPVGLARVLAVAGSEAREAGAVLG